LIFEGVQSAKSGARELIVPGVLLNGFLRNGRSVTDTHQTHNMLGSITAQPMGTSPLAAIGSIDLGEPGAVKQRYGREFCLWGKAEDLRGVVRIRFNHCGP